MQDTPEENQNRSQNASPQAEPQDSSNSGLLYADDSPELLRWRADILLDEMMLGAVDIAGGRSAKDHSLEDSLDLTQTVHHDSAVSFSDREGIGGRHAGSAAPVSSDRPQPYVRSTPWGSEEPPLPSQSSVVGATPQVTPLSDGPALRSVQGDAFLRPPTASAATALQGAALPDPRHGSASVAAPWRSGLDSLPFDSQDRRSNLLPRESQFDVTSHLHEIERLEFEIEATLPTEHEWSVRSRHLLAKAAAILKNSPERSAEVDYYLQQVRAILERAQQTDQWSKVYVKRLTVYLIGWALFSLVGLVACLLYTASLTTYVVDWFSAATDGYLSQHALPLLITLFAGTLGAALGALRNMVRYRRLGRGYIDRKYSLRTLLLPLLALLFGLLIYLLFGLVCSVANISPLKTPILGAIPALIVFVFGLVQESLYGTAA